jgi:SapC
LVDSNGAWSGSYIPAFVRRYPFMLGEMGNDRSVACIDEKYEGLNPTIGERLFTEDGAD